MTNLICKTYKNNSKSIETAENEIFSWDNDIERDSLMHKASGRYIYQSHWVENGKMTARIDDETFAQWKEFWKALEVEQERVARIVKVKTVEKKSDWYHYNSDGERELNEDF